MTSFPNEHSISEIEHALLKADKTLRPAIIPHGKIASTHWAISRESLYRRVDKVFEK